MGGAFVLSIPSSIPSDPLTLSTATAPFGFRRDLPRWRQLVTPAWIAALVAGVPQVAAPDGDWRLFEAGYGARALFDGGHIPGAGYIDTARIEHGPLWNKIDDESLLALLLAHGIRADVTVVLYGRNNLAAVRLAHFLLYAGVRDVRLLDGGFGAWRQAGLALCCAPPHPYPAALSFGAPFPGRPEFLLDMAQTRALQAHAGGVLASIRTWNEFAGKTSGYSYIDARGDIAGAVWGRAGDDDDVDSMSAYHRADGRMRPAAEIGAMWQAAGIAADRRTVFYCGTGWRASLAFFYAWLMGWDDIAVFDGGWCEWSRDSGNPVLCRVDAAAVDIDIGVPALALR